jgi:hypothetical protein
MDEVKKVLADFYKVMEIYFDKEIIFPYMFLDEIQERYRGQYDDANIYMLMLNDKLEILKVKKKQNYSFILHKSGKNIEEIKLLTDSAIELLEELYDKCELFDIDVLINAYCNKGIILKAMKNDEAKEYFEKSAILSESLYLQDRCYSMYEMFKSYHLLLEYDKSYLQRIFDLLMDIDDRAEGNCNWVFIAIYDLVINEYELEKIAEKSIAWLALSSSHDIFLSNDTVGCITGIGLGLSEFLKRNHKYDQGCKLLLKIIEVKETHGIKDQINTFFVKEIGFLFVKQNKISDGIKYYKRSIAEFERYYRYGNIEEIEEFIMVCANLGFVYFSLKEMKKARNIWVRSLLVMKEQLDKGKEVDHDILKKVSQGLLVIEQIGH